MEQLPSPWYKTRAGKIFVTLFVIFLLLVIGFSAITGYYIWIEKRGTTEQRAQLRQALSENFTLAPGLETQRASNISPKDSSELIYPYTPTLGSPDAPITVVAFIDFECPFSQKEFPVFQQVIEQYGPALHVAFKHLPVESIHPNATHAALAAQCAFEQNKFWEYYDKLFQEKQLDDDSLLLYAQQIGLNQGLFTACFAQNKYGTYIDQDLADSVEVGIRGTPTYLVNNRIVEGAISKEQWDKIIADTFREKNKTL